MTCGIENIVTRYALYYRKIVLGTFYFAQTQFCLSLCTSTNQLTSSNSKILEEGPFFFFAEKKPLFFLQKKTSGILYVHAHRCLTV